MKTLWNGTLELAEITIPVGLATTVRDGGETFRRLHAACSTPITLRSYCARDEEILDAEAGDVTVAWEAAPGEYVVLDDEERAALDPVESRRMPIDCFIPAGALDPLLVRKRYHLVPSKMAVGRRSYRLFADAIAAVDVVGLVRFVAWRSEQLAAISSDGTLLQLAILSFAEDLADMPVFDSDLEPLDEQLRDLARELVDRHTRRLRADDLVSLERPRMRELLERKLAGEPIVRPELVMQQDERAAPAAGLDLEAALERSLKHAPRRRRRRAAATAAG